MSIRSGEQTETMTLDESIQFGQMLLATWMGCRFEGQALDTWIELCAKEEARSGRNTTRLVAYGRERESDARP